MEGLFSTGPTPSSFWMFTCFLQSWEKVNLFWLHSLFPGTFGLWGSLLARGSTLVSTRYQSPVNSDRGIQEGSIILYVALSLDLFISYDRQMLWYTCVGSGRQLTAAVEAYFCVIDGYSELEMYWMEVVFERHAGWLAAELIKWIPVGLFNCGGRFQIWVI